MTGNECYRASLVVLGAGADSGEYYAQFALGALNQLAREQPARNQRGARAAGRGRLFRAAVHELARRGRTGARMARARVFPTALRRCSAPDDDKAMFNRAASEYAERLLLHCPAQFTAVQEMI